MLQNAPNTNLSMLDIVLKNLAKDSMVAGPTSMLSQNPANWDNTFMVTGKATSIHN